MKVLKKNEHAPLFRPFGVGGRMYLSVACISFFDLSEDPRVLTEQDMWKTLPAELGSSGVLDHGLPKAVGEALVTGSCHAPGGVAVPVAEVSFMVGPVRKKLLVFGDRFWRSGSQVVSAVEGPRPFTTMPVDDAHAFGGPDFADNPLGRGAAPAAVPGSNETILPLPNIEDPARLIAGPKDTPAPAGFGPIDQARPSRKKLCGTFDATWQREHWPYFPADYNWSFGNEAAGDQRLAEGFFSGGEAVEIANMNPDTPRILAKIPEIRVRVFATQIDEPLLPGARIPKDAKEKFVEIETRLDTVRLFPGVMRGVVVHRGLLPIADDEYRDVRRLFFATEALSDKPKPIEDYLAEQQKLLDRMVPAKVDPTAEINKKISRAMLKVGSIPAMIEKAKKRALGQTPVMPMETADFTRLAGSLGTQLSMVTDELESMARSMQAQYGHLAAIDLTQFERFHQAIAKAQAKTAATVAKVDAAQSKGQAKLGQAAAHLRGLPQQDKLAAAGLDPDNLLPPRKQNPWHDAAFPFVVACRRELERSPVALAKVKAAGLARIATDTTWLGINAKDRTVPGPDWGLAASETVSLPKGLVFAEFSGAVLDRIHILPFVPDYFCSLKDEFLVAGSDTRTTMHEGPPGSPVVVVPRYFGSMVLAEKVSDFATVVVACDPKTPLSKQAAEAVKQAQAFLVMLPEEPKLWDKLKDAWRSVHPKAEPVYMKGFKFVSEAKAAKVDLRELVLDALPPASVGLPEEDELAGRPRIPEFPDVKGMILSAIAEVKAAMEPRFDAAKAAEAKTMDMVKAALARAGKDPEAVLKAAAEAPRPTLADGAKQAAAGIDKARAQLAKIGQLTPERGAKLDQAQSTIAATFADADKQLAEGKAKIEAGKKQLAEGMAKVKAGEMPESAKAKFAEFGMDPDMIRQFSREEVIDFHAKGKSLAGALLTKLDLSGCDLTGADLRKTIAKDCDFGKALLTGSDLSGAAWSGCNLTGAFLDKAKADTFVVQKSVCDKAVFAGTSFKQAIFKDGSLTGADFSGAVMELCILSKNAMDGASFRGVEVKLTAIDGAAPGADFREARLTRSVIKNMDLTGASFARAKLDSTLLQGCKGEKLEFTEADLAKVRFGASSFPGASLRGADMSGAGVRDTDLSGADLSGTRLSGAMFENCLLTGAALTGASARRARFTRCDLERADLRGIDLGSGSLRKARIVAADLSGGNFFGADFFKSVVGETKFEDANLKLTFLHKREDLLP